MQFVQACRWTLVATLILPITALAAQQLVRNGSYEDGGGAVGPQPNVPAAWTLYGPASERSLQENLAPVDGVAALKAFGAVTTGAYQDVAVTAGETVEVSANLFTLGTDQIGGDALAGISLEFLDAGEAVLEQIEVLLLDGTSPTDTWIPVSTSGVAPASTAIARLSCTWTNTGTAAGSASWADCSLTVNAGANQLANADFEEAAISDMSPGGIDEWAGFESQEKSSDFAYVGTSSLKMQASGSGGGAFNGLFQDLGLVEAGDRIQLRAWALHPSSDPLTGNARGGLKLEFQAAGDAPTLPEPTQNLPIDQDAETNAWILVNLSTTGLVVPDDANFARIVMIYDVDGTAPNAPTNGMAWFDDAAVTLNGGGNALLNPSFESGPGGANGILFWTEFGLPPLSTTRKTVALDDALDGIVVAQSQGILTTGIFQDVPVSAGQVLEASVSIRIPGGSAFSPDAGITAGIKVEWQGGSAPASVDIGPTANTLLPSDPTDVWKELFIDFTMPLGSRANLRYTNLLGFVGSGTVYMDAAEAVIVNRFAGADVDSNGTMDLADYAAFQTCYNGDGANFLGWPCLVFDADEDNDVDLDDWAILDPDENFTGP